MVVAVRLQGGLGNQLFQYAAARHLAQAHGTTLALDVTSLAGRLVSAGSGQPQRQFELNALRTKGAIWRLPTKPLATRIGIKVSERLPSRLAPWFGVFREHHFHFSRTFFNLPSDIYLIGYFQSERYFSAVAETIREELQPCDERLLHQAQLDIARVRRPDRCLVSVHLRRTDYLAAAAIGEVHGLGDDYYGPAMARFGPNVDFLVFSDDLAWCRNNMRGDNIFYCSTGRALDDLLRMSLCDHHIIANSTFSWWAAWLDRKASKIVIAPRRWFGPASSHYNETADLLPPGWIAL
jgi:hypothetical protein